LAVVGPEIVTTLSKQRQHESASTEGIEHLSDALSGEFSVVEELNTKRDYQIMIEDVNSFSGYSSIQSYLNAMQAVSRLHIVSLKDKQLDLMIRLTTGIERFNQFIKKDGVMMLKTQQRGSRVLFYQLRP
jgi:CRISPR/Cas system CMR-associated protein Cmr3 (group 5 of RAMP superfamily)